MLTIAGSTGSFPATLNYMQDGDALNTANWLTVVTPMADRTAYLNAQFTNIYSGVHTWTAAQTFGAGIVLAGSVASIRYRLFSLADADASIAPGSADIFYWTPGISADRTIDIPTAGAVQGQVLTFIRTVSTGAGKILFLVDGLTTLAYNSGSDAFAVQFVFIGSNWYVFWARGDIV